MKLKKITAGLTALLLAAVLFFSAVPAGAESAGCTLQSVAYLATETTEVASNTALRDYLKEQLLACKETIDISSFNIKVSQENLNTISALIQLEIPEAIHVNVAETVYYYGGDLFVSLKPSYFYGAEELQTRLTECNKVAAALTADLAGLGDVEKALLLHDRLALLCEYDTAATVPPAHDCITLYSALVRHKTVCQGYAIAYRYLLNKVGIESRICTSAKLNHAWNIVTVNGKEYHVDVTWDDPVEDITGRVNHTNFLRSTAGIQTNHTASDFDTAPTDTTYDSYFWQSAKTAFQEVNGQLYYLDNIESAIKRYSDQTVLLRLQETWAASQISYYSESFARLASDGYYLLFSTPTTIQRLNPETGKTELLYQPDRSAGEFFQIYGFTLQDGSLICELNNDPLFKADTKALYQTKVTYNPGLSDVVVILRYIIGTAQNVNLSFLDQNGDNALTVSDAVILLRRLSA